MRFIRSSGHILLVVAIAASLLWGCQSDNEPPPKTIAISVPYSMEGVLTEIVDNYAALYPGAEINLSSGQDPEAFDLLLDGQVDMAITSSRLDEDIPLKSEWTSRLISYSAPVFYSVDSAAVLPEALSPADCTMVSTSDMRLSFCHRAPYSNLVWVFDEMPSALTICAEDFSRMRSDDVVGNLRIEIPVVDSLGNPQFASQSSISDGTYPMRHGFYAVLGTPGNNAPSHFLSYLLSEDGQRILLKAGLAPATLPTREVRVTTGFPEQ